MKTNPVCSRGQSPSDRAGCSSSSALQQDLAATPAQFCSPVFWAVLQRRGCPEEPLPGPAPPSTMEQPVQTSAGGWVGKSDGPKRSPGCRGGGLFPAPPNRLPFSPNSLCLSTTLTQIFDLRRTEYLPLPGVTCVALWFLFAKELLLCPRMKKEAAAGTCL